MPMPSSTNSADDLHALAERLTQPPAGGQRGERQPARHEADGEGREDDRIAEDRQAEPGGRGVDAGGDREQDQEQAARGVDRARASGRGSRPEKIMRSPMKPSRTTAIQ